MTGRTRELLLRAAGRSYDIFRTKKRPVYPGRFYMAEREGFEPSVKLAPYTRFPSVRLKPLGHLSSLPVL